MWSASRRRRLRRSRPTLPSCGTPGKVALNGGDDGYIDDDDDDSGRTPTHGMLLMGSVGMESIALN